MEYAQKVTDELKANGVIAHLDERNEKIGYKIRDWETHKVPYMLVVGEKEKEAGTVAVRKHKVGDQGTVSVEEFKNKILEEIKNKINHN
jgi:threonyl-tRNA synthetase